MTEAFNSAVRLLSRREHSAVELSEKLKQKGFHSEEINDALAACVRLDLQNESRFVEIYSRLRIRQGYGPLKIRQELIKKGVDKDLVHRILAQEHANWLTYALEVWQKKSRGQMDLSFDELQKQQRFLLYRGFDRDTIAQVTKELKK